MLRRCPSSSRSAARSRCAEPYRTSSYARVSASKSTGALGVGLRHRGRELRRCQRRVLVHPAAGERREHLAVPAPHPVRRRLPARDPARWRRRLRERCARHRRGRRRGRQVRLHRLRRESAHEPDHAPDREDEEGETQHPSQERGLSDAIHGASPRARGAPLCPFQHAPGPLGVDAQLVDEPEDGSRELLEHEHQQRTRARCPPAPGTTRGDRAPRRAGRARPRRPSRREPRGVGHRAPEPALALVRSGAPRRRRSSTRIPPGSPAIRRRTRASAR